MTKSKSWKHSFFIGVDISRNTLDFALMKRSVYIKHFNIANDPYEIQQLIKLMKQEHELVIPDAIFGMEQTGYYCNHLINVLEKIKAKYVIEDPRHIRNSLGNLRGKTDKVDAERIATFLFRTRDDLKPHKSRRQLVEKLLKLTSLRSRLISIQKALRTPLKEESTFIDKAASELNTSFCIATVDSIKNDIANLESHIEKSWKDDENINNLMRFVTSVPGVGVVTGLQIILLTNEFMSISDPRKFASYAGVAPFEFSSGTSVRLRTKVSNMANKKLKALLHSCALSARIHNPEIKRYFIRKTEIEGKHKMSVLNAIRFKLILRIFSCVNHQRTYIEDFQNEIQC